MLVLSAHEDDFELSVEFDAVAELWSEITQGSHPRFRPACCFTGPSTRVARRGLNQIGLGWLMSQITTTLQAGEFVDEISIPVKLCQSLHTEPREVKKYEDMVPFWDKR